MAVLATGALAWSSWKSSSFKCGSLQTEIKHRSSPYNRQTAVTEGAVVFPVTTLKRWSCMCLLLRNTLNPYHLYTLNWDLNHNRVYTTFIQYELNVSLWMGWVQECSSEKIQNGRFKTDWMSALKLRKRERHETCFSHPQQLMLDRRPTSRLWATDHCELLPTTWTVWLSSCLRGLSLCQLLPPWKKLKESKWQRHYFFHFPIVLEMLHVQCGLNLAPPTPPATQKYMIQEILTKKSQNRLNFLSFSPNTMHPMPHMLFTYLPLDF